jgi:hypothetical protein
LEKDSVSVTIQKWPSKLSLAGILNHGKEERSMSTETVEAVYEHGSFRIVAPADLNFVEGQKVRLVVEPMERRPDEILALAAGVYDGLTCEETASIEEHLRRRQDFFGESVPE